jgi:hypothetical protein
MEASVIIGGVVLCLIAVVLYLVGQYGDFAGADASLNLAALHATIAFCTISGAMLLAYGIDRKRKKNLDDDFESGSTSMLGLGSSDKDIATKGSSTPPADEVPQKAED